MQRRENKDANYAFIEILGHKTETHKKRVKSFALSRRHIVCFHNNKTDRQMSH